MYLSRIIHESIARYPVVHLSRQWESRCGCLEPCPQWSQSLRGQSNDQRNDWPPSQRPRRASQPPEPSRAVSQTSRRSGGTSAQRSCDCQELAHVCQWSLASTCHGAACVCHQCARRSVRRDLATAEASQPAEWGPGSGTVTGARSGCVSGSSAVGEHLFEGCVGNCAAVHALGCCVCTWILLVRQMPSVFGKSE